MTTQPTQPENNDTQVSVVEESSASQSDSLQGTNGEPFESQPANALRATASQSDSLQGTTPATSDEKEIAPPTQETEAPPSQTPEAYTPDIAIPEITVEAAVSETFMPEESLRSFSSYIEEFRQAEERLGGPAQEFQQPLAEPFSALTSVENSANVGSINQAPTAEEQTEEGVKEEGAEGAINRAPTQQEEAESIAPAKPAERPVSPLLRPPTRIRMPRHGGGRQRETFTGQNAARAAQETPAEQANAGVVEPTTTEAVRFDEPAPEADQTEQQEQPRPARRYRFDRPAPQTSQIPAASITPTKAAPVAASPSSPARIEETSAPIRPANDAAASEPGRSDNKAVEQQSARPAASTGSSAATTENEGQTTSGQTQDRRRRHGQERQRAKTQPAAPATPVVATTPAIEEAVPVAEPVVPVGSETPVEDLPPLEYSELQAASSRRRRRRRANGATPSLPAASTKPTTPEQPAAAGPSPASPLAPGAPSTPVRGVVVPTPPYTIQSGFTVSQMNQGNDVKGPFMGPEPSPARGSISSTSSRTVRPIRNGNEAQRTPIYPAARTGEPVVSPGSINHLANVISQAIQTQSDRMIAELRHANQAPTNISVALPPFPSTERVGVFVDVANLLYSARTLRMTIDFGKLLDFLRGNRRLVRAHAYCPTSPQPGDDQMFLQAVKGLGYRITTKNYKTFASGAKKADMDLDLCMDVVRLVDGKAVDCIVLVSGDSDFMPMLDYCSDHGVRVEVAAFDESMSATLRQSCDLFVNLSMLNEIRV
ncbi:MAG: NYN domain-containing protein [Chloroflexi bacterium]|nr:MAG: NYN domain-containing protein [Chloroflexota bacterium]